MDEYETLKEHYPQLTKFAEYILDNYDFNIAKLVRMEEDAEESDEISDIKDSDTYDI